MDLQALFSDATLELWAQLGTVLGTLLLLAATLWASTQLSRQVRSLWWVVRGHRQEIVAAIDEPTDPLVVQLAKYTGVPASVWVAFLPAFFTALASGFDKAWGDSDTPTT